MAEADVNSVLQTVASAITPNEKDELKIEKAKKIIFDRLALVSSDFVPELEGSVAKGTWLAQSPELDVFLLFPKTVSRNYMENRIIEAAKAVLRKWQISYAEHPYVKGEVLGVSVDLVPCYRVSSPSEMQSAVDRTPFHTRFMNEHLTAEQKRDVRLLKAFFKGIGVYGAEIKVRGFSGYASEVLIYRFGNFVKLLREASHWRGKVNLGWDGESEALGLPDPVDEKRNVTASVSLNSLSTFIAAAGFFLRFPSEVFFWNKGFVEGDLNGILVLKTGKPNGVEDVLWGEIWKASAAIQKYMEGLGFEIWDSSAFADEQNVFFFYSLQSHERPPSTLVLGPPVYMSDNALDFIKKWINDSSLLRGPWIRDGRWALVKSFGGSSESLLREGLDRDLGSLGLGEFEAEFKKGYEIGVGKRSLSLSRKKSYRQALAWFSSSRPGWLSAL